MPSKQIRWDRVAILAALAVHWTLMTYTAHVLTVVAAQRNECLAGQENPKP
jgi:hypothetical protein